VGAEARRGRQSAVPLNDDAGEHEEPRGGGMPLDDGLVDEAVEHLERILNEIAVGYVHLDRAELVARIEEIRAEVVLCRRVLTEGASLR